jgi:alginate O-acetyltransferase complex protein AlgI
MEFSTLHFLYFFLPCCLIFHYLFKSMAYRNAILILFSLIFYAWGEPIMILVLLFTSFFDYANGRMIEKFRGTGKAKAILALSVIVNIGTLIAFKYSGFIYDNINYLVELPFPRPEVLKPFGISFYIFRTISYTIDVYRGTVNAEKNPFIYLLFISLFPLTYMGPIARYQHLQDNLHKRSFDWKDFSTGINRFCLGLFKKMLITSIAWDLTKKYLINGFSDLAAGDAWFGILAFSIYLYFDFSSYSDMAIGIGRMFGLKIQENFRHPYAAVSVADFYRRWHISLGQFFRDYVYIPLGGNRKWQDRNIFIVWMLTGLWHGAQWNFVMWGCYFGILMIIEKYAQPVLKVTPRFIKHIYVLILIVFSRGIFFFEDFDMLWNFMGHHLFDFSAFSNLDVAGDVITHAYWLGLVVLFCIPWNELKWNSGRFYAFSTKMYYAASPVINVGFIVVSTAMMVASSFSPSYYDKF